MQRWQEFNACDEMYLHYNLLFEELHYIHCSPLSTALC